MKCPVCKIDMIVVEYKNVEVDYCTKCSGVWFDCGELELLLEKVGAKESDLCQTTPTASTEKGRRCPICGKKMNKSLMGEDPKVLVDACPRGEGLWFDGGELEHIAKQVATKVGKPSSKAVVSFLSDLFKGEQK